MLLRGDNAVGYTNYPSWVIKDFIRLTCETGLDLFRIFDCLNNLSQMKIAIEEVKNQDKIVEATLCYTGNILDGKRAKYNLKYYIDKAIELRNAGSDILAIKDMAGLLRPEAAKILISELKDKVEIPVHLHTHDTSGGSIATLLAAAYAGCDIVDGAISSMSGLTSQPSLNSVIASLEGTVIQPKVSLDILDSVDPYWEEVRKMYLAYDPGVKSSTTRVYHHEIPGGQYSNLYDQAKKLGVSADDFRQLTDRYKEVNDLLGDIIKVTPSSKVVGDFALLLQKANLTGPELLAKKPSLDYPDSVIGFLKGDLGTPHGGFPQEIRDLVLGKGSSNQNIHSPKAEISKDEVAEKLTTLTGEKPTEKQIITYALYPKVYLEYLAHIKKYGEISQLPTPVFLYGLEVNDEVSVELEAGKTLIISLNGFSEPNEEGKRKIFFSLNGFPRELEIEDKEASKSSTSRKKSDPTNPGHIGAMMPGKVLEVKIETGDLVSLGDTLFVTESMKMEYAITAKVSGKVQTINANIGDEVNTDDLLCVIKS